MSLQDERREFFCAGGEEKMITSPEHKINNQTILQEQFDENYEPTQEEIREYAVYIGIDPEKVKRKKKNLQLTWKIFV